MKRSILFLILAAGVFSALSRRAEAKVWSRTDEGGMDCSSSHFRDNDLTSYAETREQRLPAASTNYINPGQNGSIRVHGWNNSDVLVKACIQAAAPSESEARAVATQVTIARGAGSIEPSGPATGDRLYWGVSYEVWVPNGSNVKMDANNGSISVDSVRGQIRFHTSNGSVHLSDVGGDVDGSTTNGSVSVELAGNGWNGSGLHVETTNGSVKLDLPENFSAQIQASTVNGRVHSDFPITVSGGHWKEHVFSARIGRTNDRSQDCERECPHRPPVVIASLPSKPWLPIRDARPARGAVRRR